MKNRSVRRAFGQSGFYKRLFFGLGFLLFHILQYIADLTVEYFA